MTSTLQALRKTVEKLAHPDVKIPRKCKSISIYLLYLHMAISKKGQPQKMEKKFFFSRFIFLIYAYKLIDSKKKINGKRITTTFSTYLCILENMHLEQQYSNLKHIYDLKNIFY